MLVLKCNLCKKDIKGKPITAGFDFLARIDLCEKCGKPIKDFLKKHKFIKTEKLFK